MTDDGYIDDYKALLEMARDKTASSRARLAAAARDLSSRGGEALTDYERVLMSGIMRRLLHDAEMPVRRGLSARLGALEKVPADVMATLADDAVEIAYPILEKSELLEDFDLIEIVRHRTLQHQLSLALRRSVGASVTGALAEPGDGDAIEALLENADAGVSKAATEYLVEQAKRADSYQNPILRRPDLDAALAGRIYWWVSAALRRHLVARFAIDPAELDDRLDKTVREIIAREADGDAGMGWAQELARRLAEAGALTPETMIGILRHGEIPLFEAMFAEISGLRLRLVRRILYEPGGEALAVLCRAVDMSRDDFAALFALTRKAAFGKQPSNPAERDRVLELYRRLILKAAQAVLTRWRTDPRYLDAMRLLSNQNEQNPKPNDTTATDP